MSTIGQPAGKTSHRSIPNHQLSLWKEKKKTQKKKRIWKANVLCIQERHDKNQKNQVDVLAEVKQYYMVNCFDLLIHKRQLEAWFGAYSQCKMPNSQS